MPSFPPPSPIPPMLLPAPSLLPPCLPVPFLLLVSLYGHWVPCLVGDGTLWVATLFKSSVPLALILCPLFDEPRNPHNTFANPLENCPRVENPRIQTQVWALP